MYDYERRTALQHYETYVEALKGAIRRYGVKQGHERQIADAKRVAEQLDRELKEYKGVSTDDSWAHDNGKMKKLWSKLQELFAYCFGYDPPALDSFI